MIEYKCEICEDKKYLVSTRDDGKDAVEACDNCRTSTFNDEDAAKLAKHDGVDCCDSYPHYVAEDIIAEDTSIANYFQEVTVTDPETGEKILVSMYKDSKSGKIVGLESGYTDNFALFGDCIPNPYDDGCKLIEIINDPNEDS